jgi:hypothetical protein
MTKLSSEQTGIIDYVMPNANLNSEVPLWQAELYSRIEASPLRAGRMWRLSAAGIIATVTGDITFKIYWGTIGGALLLGTAVVNFAEWSDNEKHFFIDALLTIRLPAGGTLENAFNNGFAAYAHARITAPSGKVIPFTFNAALTSDIEIPTVITVSAESSEDGDNLAVSFVALEEIK